MYCAVFAALFPIAWATIPIVDAAADEPAYLAFQVFTSSPNVHVGFGGEGVLTAIPSLRILSDFADDIVARIGDTGRENRRLALIFGPLAFDQTDTQIEQLISTVFDIALSKHIAVGFHIDDSMFWGRRNDLLSDPANIERPGWGEAPTQGRMLDWGPSPTRAPPSICINAKAVEREVRKRAAVIGKAISLGRERLRAAGEDDLFAAVLSGWETQIGREFPSGRAEGYCALANRGLKPGASEQDLYDGRVAAVADFITLWAESLSQAGVPEDRIYSHVAFAMQGSKEPQVRFAPPSVAVGPHRRAGFSTYPSPGVFDELAAFDRAHGGAPWASSEGANVLLAWGATNSGMGMETYLAKLFNNGARLVNIFGWGIGDKTNDFRKAAEDPSAIEAYRKFLRGEALIEGQMAETIIERVQKKIARIQAELPSWVQRTSAQARVAPLLEALNQAMASQNPVQVEAAEDALLALVGGK